MSFEYDSEWLAENKKYIVYFLISFSLLGLLAGYVIQNRPAEINPDTFCGVGVSPPKHSVIIVDKTDKWSSVSGDALEKVILSFRDSIARGEKISIFELNSSLEESLFPRFMLCSPGTEKEYGIWEMGHKLVRKQYLDRFKKPIAKLVSDLKKSKEAELTPLIEFFEKIFSSSEIELGKTKFLIFSDMRQNSELYSVFGKKIKNGGLTSALKEKITDGSKIDISIYFIDHSKFRSSPESLLNKIWTNAFESIDAKITWNSI